MAAATLPRGLVMPEIRKTPMWFAHPADRWLQALPVGNGRLSAMVFGGAARERLHLTESTLWSGAPSVRDLNPTARESIPAIRNLFFAGRYTEADCDEGRHKQFVAGVQAGYQPSPRIRAFSESSQTEPEIAVRC